MMAGLVKIFKIQRIIPNLFNCGPVEFFFTNLELDHKNHWANN